MSPQAGHSLNPVYNFLDISTNTPILAASAEPEHIDAKDDLLAPLKVHRYSRRLWAALLAEFLGLAIFQIYGGSANDDVAALASGITLAVIVYATCNVSGGHLNPAVSFAQCLTGHMSWSKGGVYTIAQVLGGIFGALVEGPGCFTHLKGVQISKAQLFWWECIMTFVLVSVVYATAVTKPGHGSLAPLAIGFTLYASAAVAGPYTGAALNPARVFGPALVFNCYWNTAFVYIFGQLLGGFLAAVLVLPLYGFGQFGSVFDTRIFSWLGLNIPHRFQELPERDSSPSSSQRPRTGANSYEMSQVRSYDLPAAPPTTPAAARSGNDDKLKLFATPSSGKESTALVRASTEARSVPVGNSSLGQAKSDTSDFLPPSWKVGSHASPRPY